MTQRCFQFYLLLTLQVVAMWLPWWTKDISNTKFCREKQHHPTDDVEEKIEETLQT